MCIPLAKTKKLFFFLFLICLVLSCSWFQRTPLPETPLPTILPSLTAEALPTPGLIIQSNGVSIKVNEQVVITVQTENILDVNCDKLYYRDGSMLSFGWLGESESQLLELVPPILSERNFTFTLVGKSPGTAELKAACSGNVLFKFGKESVVNQWYGVSEPILITVH